MWFRVTAATKGAAEGRTVELVYKDSDQGKSVESDTRKALEWMQRDVERQARENRTVRETLARAIHDITDVIADFVAPDAANVLVQTAVAATGMLPERDNNVAMLHLAPDKVDELVNQWDDALVSWKEQSIVEKQELVEGFAQFEEECLARMKAGEASHRLKQERLALESNEQQMICEDVMSRLTRRLEDAQSMIESLQTQVAELSSTLITVCSANAHPLSCEAATMTNDKDSENDNLQRQVLDFAARAKSSELHALQYKIALSEQVQRTNEMENRLHMLLEEYEGRQHQQQHPHLISIEAMQLYQQKLELLEGRMQDVMEQVACDHEQFEYEQAKWALEKRHHREKYDEVLDASVKVLKVLIIREKLMKKNERAQTRASQEYQEKQLELACQAATLQGISTELMQQSAMVLLVLQQLAVLKSNASQHSTSSTWTLPAKPVQMKNMIKRLKKIEAALGRHQRTSPTPVKASVLTTKVCPFPT
ncbi:Hypothetical protein PHPALM_4144 [Phytophthora palmivora]|uniref:Uncharacterized protein n=1 Tax=Phytophthora palmivora TaxID=4796 RepID=A0A2P4YKK9_9STRA|nr:Hypothetical protein PHPALM_4144 [Phytophthora palmivora]